MCRDEGHDAVVEMSILMGSLCSVLVALPMPSSFHLLVRDTNAHSHHQELLQGA